MKLTTDTERSAVNEAMGQFNRFLSRQIPNKTQSELIFLLSPLILDNLVSFQLKSLCNEKKKKPNK